MQTLEMNVNTRKTAAVILTVLQIQMLKASETPFEIFVPNFLTFPTFLICTLQTKFFLGGSLVFKIFSELPRRTASSHFDCSSWQQSE